ncbi:hypothetical protein PANT_5c00002 [Moesziomyces antarcticus T-34]|uniref:AB hydrolase-1 domain-containing protein n=1 Tax=Pseudozyma antarctica (strain T-34) TaxID=1151754 RepID=M9MCE4_PSEA3|nr:hypothetical protein PANT_5c00002 [Moesziomyces antarcticus T-34]
MDPVAYLSQVRFHQSIQCRRTHSRVTFALGGSGWDSAVTSKYGTINAAGSGKDAYHHQGPLLLYLLPSGCSRLLGMILEGICRESNVSILAIDRPGSGGTPMCPLEQRIQTATQQTLSVFEALQLDRPGMPQLRLLSHSAGWFYTLALLQAAPQYLARPDSPLKVVLSSPFVPTSQSSSTTLSLLPKGLVALTPKVMPFLGRSMNWSTGVADDIASVGKGWVAWSSADVDPAQLQEQKRVEREKLDQKNREVRARSKQKHPRARFHPPYESHLKFGLDAWKHIEHHADMTPRHPKTGRRLKTGGDLLFDYVQEEGSMAGVCEDYQLCLGNAPSLNNDALTYWIVEALDKVLTSVVSLSSQPVQLVVVWGDADFLIPRKGRDWLDSVLKPHERDSKVKYERWDMAEGGHDATLFSEDVMNDVLAFLIGAAD